MLHYSLYILVFVIIAALVQTKTKIPSPVTLIGLALAGRTSGLIPPVVDATEFDTLVLMTLPLLVAADALKLHVSELRKHAAALFSMAVVMVVLSVGIGTLALTQFDSFKALPLAALVLLMCMVCATDPVTVSAVFSNFEVPHDLKLLTEGESLFNDATALIVFSLALYSLAVGSEGLTFSAISLKVTTVIIGATAVGLLCGAIGYLMLRSTKDPFIEAACLMLVAYGGYTLAEHFHWSGILAVIVGCLFANHEINKSYVGAQSLLDFKAPLLKEAPSTLHNMQVIHKSIDFLALFAAAALFVSIGMVFDIELCAQYWKEILVVFGISTLIRFFLLKGFSKMSQKFDKITSVPSNWVGILTLAGSKGALSILMVHMIPSHFSWKPQLEQIVVGNILLSILLYAPILLVLVGRSKLESSPH